MLGEYSEAYGGVSRVGSVLVQFLTLSSLIQHYILINAAYAGPLSAGKALIQPLLDLGPIKENISEIPWSKLTETAFFEAEGSLPNPCIKGLHQNVYGGSIKTYDIPTFQNWVAELDMFYSEYPNARGSIWFIEHFATQAVKAVSDEATAYPWRDITAHLYVETLLTSWMTFSGICGYNSSFSFGRSLTPLNFSRLFNYAYNDSTLEAPVNAFARKARAQFNATSGFDSLQIYVSYGHRDEGLHALYGSTKLHRLQALKRQWDPQNLFRFNEGL